MRDNGLLKCYPEYLNQYGMLDIGKLGKTQFKDNILELTDTQGIFSGLYYAKTCYFDKMQLEVLISQIVADYGLDTSIYLPGVFSGSFAVVSNDVKGENGKPLFKYLMDNRAVDPYFKSPFEEFNRYTTEELNLQKLFTQNGLKEYVDAHIIRTACGDMDGHAGNIIVRTVNTSKNNPGQVDSISLIDYGMANVYMDSNCKESMCFSNGLGGGFEKTIDKMIGVFKENEIVQSFYTNTEIAEKLGSIDVHEHVADIRETIGLNIMPRIEDNITRTINYVAEEMVK